MLDFLGRFSTKLTELSVPLREISDVRGPYQQTLQAVQCFQAIQVILDKDIKLPYSGTQKNTTLQTDTLIKGLGAVLIQDGVPVYIASRTLTPTEKNYQNLEHETLATI